MRIIGDAIFARQSALRTPSHSMLDAGIQSFVELSPHPVLSSMVLECAEAFSRPAEALPSLRRGCPERIQSFQSLSSLFAAGTDIDWDGVYPEGGRVTPLPNYPWQRKRFWFDKSPAEFRPAALGVLLSWENARPAMGEDCIRLVSRDSFSRPD